VRDAVAPPGSTGRDQHLVEAELQYLRGIERAVVEDLDIRHLRKLIGAIILHPAPGGEAWQLLLLSHAAAERGGCFGEGHVIAALPERTRRFQSGGTGADDQHPCLGFLRPNELGMPAAAPFLAHRGVLGAAAGRHGHVAGDADVAADAFADVLDPAFLDLLREEGIGDRGPRRADEIQQALADLPHHLVRAR
jgi:hypothetical protein